MTIVPIMHRLYFSRRFATFLAFGGTAAAVNLAVGWLIYRRHVIEVPYVAGVVIGATAGLLVNFLLNYFFNFKFRDRSALAQLRSFVGVSVIGIALTAIISELLNRLLPVAFIDLAGKRISREFMAHFMAVGLVTFYSYAAHSYLTFSVGFRERGKQLLSRRKK